MAEEDTRKLLRTFGVTVTNFQEHSTQLLEQAQQLRLQGNVDGMLPLLKDFTGELLICRDAGWKSPTTFSRSSGRY